MSDYYSLLKRAIEKEPPTGEARRVVYEKARTALVKQLRSVDPPLTEAQITRQCLTLEEAIRRIEAEASEDQVRPATQAPGRSAERPPASRPPPQAERPASRAAAPAARARPDRGASCRGVA